MRKKRWENLRRGGKGKEEGGGSLSRTQWKRGKKKGEGRKGEKKGSTPLLSLWQEGKKGLKAMKERRRKRKRKEEGRRRMSA